MTVVTKLVAITNVENIPIPPLINLKEKFAAKAHEVGDKNALIHMLFSVTYTKKLQIFIKTLLFSRETF